MAITAATAAEVRKRERDRCQLCGVTEGHAPEVRMEIHHVRLKGIGGTSDPDRDHPDHLALLHRGCHKAVHDNPRAARARGLLESRLGQVRPSALIARRPA
jgi:hypothetical protein